MCDLSFLFICSGTRTPEEGSFFPSMLNNSVQGSQILACGSSWVLCEAKVNKIRMQGVWGEDVGRMSTSTVHWILLQVAVPRCRRAESQFTLGPRHQQEGIHHWLLQEWLPAPWLLVSFHRVLWVFVFVFFWISFGFKEKLQREFPYNPHLSRISLIINVLISRVYLSD